MMKRLLLFLLTISASAIAQEWTWHSRLGRMDSYMMKPSFQLGLANDIFLTSEVYDSTFYSGSAAIGTGRHQRSLSRYSQDGTLIWKKESSEYVFRNFAVLTDNSVVTAGEVNGPGMLEEDFVTDSAWVGQTPLIRLNESGNIEHVSLLREDHLWEIIALHDGGYMLYGLLMDSLVCADTILYATTSGYEERYLLRYDAANNFVSARQFLMQDPVRFDGREPSGLLRWIVGYVDTAHFAGTEFPLHADGHIRSLLMYTDEELQVSNYKDLPFFDTYLGVDFDSDNNLFVAGYYADSVTVCGQTLYDTLHHPAMGGGNSVIVKWDSPGNCLLMIPVYNPYRQEPLYNFAVTSGGEMYFITDIADSLSIGTATVYADPGTYSSRRVLVKLNAAGMVEWVQYPDSYHMEISGFEVNEGGALVMAGDHYQYLQLGPFSDTAWFNPGCLQTNGFIAKLGAGATTLSEPISDGEDIRLAYPVPANEELYFSPESTAKFSEYRLYDLSGRQMAAGKVSNRSLNIDHLAQGCYILQMQGETACASQKIIKEQ